MKIKKLLSVILSLCIMISCVPLVFAQESQIKGYVDFQVVSDIHFQSTEVLGDLSTKDSFDSENVFYDASVQGQMNNISEAITRDFFDDFLASDKEILLVPGDLTNGNKLNHNALAQIMQSVLDRAEAQGKTKRIFVINGNHDIDPDNETKINSREEFIGCYNNFGYNNAVTVDSNTCSYVADLNDSFRLIAVDSCVYGEDYGKIDKEMLSWINEQTENAKAEGKNVIAMMHHSLLTHFGVQSMIDNYMSVAKSFISMGIKYVFTGHMHGNDIAEAENNSQKIYDIETGSLITSPCSYRDISIGEDKTEVKTLYVSKVEEEYLPQGLTDAQKDLILNDFSSYGKSFFEKGILNWLNRYIGSASVVGRKLKIDSDSFIYKIIDSALSCVGNAINMPLYNSENSVGNYDSFEELADAYGHTIPESEYQYPYEPIAKIVTSFFTGDENVKFGDVEVKLLTTVITTGIQYALTDIIFGKNNNVNEKTFDYIKSGKVKFVSKLFYADFVAKLIIAPLVEGISSDIYSPSDLNVVLDGTNTYTKSVSPVPLSSFGKIKNFVKSVINAFANY